MLLFNRNLEYLMKINSVTQQVLAQHVGVVHTTVGNYTKDKTPNIEVLTKICQFFGIEPNDIILKDLSTGIDPKKLENIALPGKISGSNVLVPESAQTGYVAEWTADFIQQLTYVNIPEVEGEARTFEVYGNSMSPILNEGDYVVCTPGSMAELKPGRIYAIVRVQSYTDAHPVKITYAQLEHRQVLCMPVNKKEFTSYHLNEQEVKEVWVAEMRITRSLGDEWKNWDLEYRLAVLEDIITSKFPDEKLR